MLIDKELAKAIKKAKDRLIIKKYNRGYLISNSLWLVYVNNMDTYKQTFIQIINFFGFPLPDEGEYRKGELIFNPAPSNIKKVYEDAQQKQYKYQVQKTGWMYEYKNPSIITRFFVGGKIALEVNEQFVSMFDNFQCFTNGDKEPLAFFDSDILLGCVCPIKSNTPEIVLNALCQSV